MSSGFRLLKKVPAPLGLQPMTECTRFWWLLVWHNCSGGFAAGCCDERRVCETEAVESWWETVRTLNPKPQTPGLKPQSAICSPSSTPETYPFAKPNSTSCILKEAWPKPAPSRLIGFYVEGLLMIRTGWCGTFYYG